MKEKKFYETPFTAVTQIVTEGVFAASGPKGTVIPIEDEAVHIHKQAGFDDIDLSSKTTWE